MRTFDQQINEAIEKLLEQTPDEVLGAAAPPEQGATDPTLAGEIPPDQPDEAIEPEVTALSPEAEVVLVKFIRKALLTDLDLEDKAKLINAIPNDRDIDESNAKQVLEILQSIIGAYSTTKTTEEDKDKLNIPD